MLDEWATNNAPLTQLIDRHEDWDVIANSLSWRALCEHQRNSGLLSDIVFVFEIVVYLIGVDCVSIEKIEKCVY